MRIDVVTIFADFFAPLSLSLVGKAASKGLVTFHIHDLRDFADDPHRSVDDSPYGGGPGMVMSPEPWAAAIEAIRTTRRAPKCPLIIPTPAGRPFDHALAQQWSTQDQLLFACGRYEGIDDRVATYHRDQGWPVEEVSLGDFVLNGGEVAAVAMIEAVVRLIPGVLGNESSVLEESHAAGLLEAPTFTKPASWRGLDVPSPLMSGNHAAILRWRRDESLRRTAAVRPDLIARLSPNSCDEADLQLLADLGFQPIDQGFGRPDA